MNEARRAAELLGRDSAAPAAPSPGGDCTVLRLLTRMNVGGPARHALLLTRGLASEFPTLLAAGRPDASEGELVDPGVPVHAVPLVRPLRPRDDLRALIAVRRLLEVSGARLLHTHMAKAGAIGRTAAWTLRPRPRLTHTFHGHVLDGYFPPLQQRAFLDVERALARMTDVLVAISPEVRDALLDLGVGRPAQYHVIPVGLDLELYLAVTGQSGSLRTMLGLDREVPLVGVLGRLVPIKDHPTLLDAMTHLPGVHLAVIGDGEQRAALEASARSSGIADRVHFTGWWKDVSAALADLDVVTLSSRNEGTPVALIEALAAGRPVVATDVGGVRSVVTDGVTGWLAPAGDSKALAGHIGMLLADPDLRRRMGLAGREDVRKRFGEARLIEDMSALYREMLGP